MKKQPLWLSVLILLIGLFSACKDGQSPLSGRFDGQKTEFASGFAQTYVVTRDGDEPLEIGVALDLEAYQQLLDHNQVIEASLEFPAEARLTPYRHTLFNWLPHGHEPAGIYTHGHFDVHFYETTPADRMAITEADTLAGNVFPQPGYFPANYFPTGLVPQMGVHWLDATTPELNGQPFNSTFIYGSFNGEIIFIEPMISKAFVDEKQNFETEINQPAQYGDAGKYYPLRYGFRFDASRQEYQFYMRDFVKR